MTVARPSPAVQSIDWSLNRRLQALGFARLSVEEVWCRFGRYDLLTVYLAAFKASSGEGSRVQVSGGS